MATDVRHLMRATLGILNDNGCDSYKPAVGGSVSVLFVCCLCAIKYIRDERGESRSANGPCHHLVIHATSFIFLLKFHFLESTVVANFQCLREQLQFKLHLVMVFCGKGGEHKLKAKIKSILARIEGSQFF